MTLEQRVYDLLASVGGTMLANHVTTILGVEKSDTIGRRLSRKGIITRVGHSNASRWTLIPGAKRPVDGRGRAPGSVAQRYGAERKNDPSKYETRRGKNRVKVEDGVSLWSCWRTSPLLHDSENSVAILAHPARPPKA